MNFCSLNSAPCLIKLFQYLLPGNPRKMVATWAEKEMRNLGRLNSAGIPAPKPLELRAHGELLIKF